ncbi:hypothetical protein LWI28_000616 [Acer negundo]|uniref:Uncharacterized protein n=1 Tax=Acer negundo TaxID=4023 RepID=A0AAD5NYZ0_ACENE|nr:hypothetical protein LWI28_000616 [Acer negundo]
MAVAFYDVNSAAGLEKLDEYLLTRSYITGHIDALLRISGFSAEGSGVLVEGSAPITVEAVAPPPVDSKATVAEDDDDNMDLFGEETEEEKKVAVSDPLGTSCTSSAASNPPGTSCSNNDVYVIPVPAKMFQSSQRKNFCRAAAFVSVLVFVFGYNFVSSSISGVLITYFTEKPTNYDLVKAAELATVLGLVSAPVQIVVAYMLDAHFSNLKIIRCSIASTFIGLVLLTLNYLMKWGGRYKFVYIVGIFLLAVGEGVYPQLNVFLEDQLSCQEPVDTNENKYPIKVRKRVWRIVAWLCSVAATLFISKYSWKKVFDFWKMAFATSISILVVTFILFRCGIPFYHRKEFTGAGSSRFKFFPVVKAFWLKKHLPCPPPSPENYFYDPDIHDHQNQKHLSPQVKILRWLDKAAIIEHNLSLQDQKEAGRLCTVEQVKEAKLLLKMILKMIPMWSTFLVIGLVSSTGEIFSSEQGEYLKDPNGVSFYLVFYLQPISQEMISYLFDEFLSPKRIPKTQYKLTKILRIWIGMVLCTIFCAVAWRVEVGRLQEKIKSVYWLAPQYCILGLMLGFCADGLDEFTIDELPKSLQNYASAMNGFVIDGLGSFLSIIFIHAKRNIFGYTLDESRLDTYYMILMIISFLNVCYYYFISTIYSGPTLYPQAEFVERDITNSR